MLTAVEFCHLLRRYLHHIQEIKTAFLPQCPMTKLIWSNLFFLFLFSSPSLAVFKSLAFADIRDAVKVLSTVKNKINTPSKNLCEQKIHTPFWLCEMAFKASCVSTVHQSDLCEWICSGSKEYPKCCLLSFYFILFFYRAGLIRSTNMIRLHLETEHVVKEFKK